MPPVDPRATAQQGSNILDSITNAAKSAGSSFLSRFPSVRQTLTSAATVQGPTSETPDVYMGTSQGAADDQEDKDSLTNANKALFTSAGLKKAGHAILSSAAEDLTPSLSGFAPKHYYDQATQGDVPGAIGSFLGDASQAAAAIAGHRLAAEHPAVAQQALSEHAAHGGSTTDPRTGQSLTGTRNWSVGVAPEATQVSERPFTPEEYNNFASIHKDTLSQHNNSAIGTSFDPSSGLHSMEVVATTPSKAAAAAMGSTLGENSIYHVGHDESVPLNPGTERPLTHLSIDDRLQQVAGNSPTKVPFSGVHFSDAKLDTLDGARRGTGAGGEENARLRLGSQTGLGKDAPPGSYVYTAGSLPESQMSARKNAYSVRGKMAFGTTDAPEFQQGYQEGSQTALAKGADPQTAHSLGLNAAEHSMRDAGYDGYYNASHPHIRFIFDSHEVQPTGKYQPPKIDAFSVDDPTMQDATKAQRGRQAEVEKKYPVTPGSLRGQPDPFAPPKKPAASEPFADWPQSYRDNAQNLSGNGGANYSADELQAFKDKHNIGK